MLLKIWSRPSFKTLYICQESKRKAMSVYKVIEIIGTSKKSWDDAANEAVSRASKTLKDLRIAEVVSQDVKIEDGNISEYRTKLSLSFKFKEG